MSKGKLAIVGIGEVPTGTYPQRSRWDIIYDTCIQAVRDAGIDKKITSYAAWKIDKNQDKFFEKIRTIHRRLLETLDADEEQNHLIGVQDLLALEREAYIFLALVGGSTSRSVLLSALKEYGQPQSDIYQLQGSAAHMADLLQLLKIVVRGIGRIGDNDQSIVLDQVRGHLQVFLEMIKSLHGEDLIHQIQEYLDEFCYRFNRRFWEFELPLRLLNACLSHAPVRG